MPPSPAQILVRNAFKKCVHCFGNQPESGGVTPPDIGPRDRSWWYGQAGAMWYYNYFIQQSWSDFYSGIVPEFCREMDNEQGVLQNYSRRGGDYRENWNANFSYMGVKNNHYPGGNFAERALWGVYIGAITQEDISKCSDIVFYPTVLRAKLVSGYYNETPFNITFYAYTWDGVAYPADWSVMGGGVSVGSLNQPVVAVDTYYFPQLSIKNVVAQAIQQEVDYIIIFNMSDYEDWTLDPNWSWTYGANSPSYKSYYRILW